MSNPYEILFFFVILFQFANGATVVLRIKAIDNHKERLFVCKVGKTAKVKEKTAIENIDDKVKSPLNYTGGKYKLLNQIIPIFPNDLDLFVDLFSFCKFYYIENHHFLLCRNFPSFFRFKFFKQK